MTGKQTPALKPLIDAKTVEAAVAAAGARIAPLWPLKHFVAVNPYLGLADRSLAEAERIMAGATGARLTMPRSFYADAIRTGRIEDQDLAAALKTASDAPKGLDLEGLKKAAATPEAADVAAPQPLPTVADAALAAIGEDWPDFLTDRVTGFAGAYFDEGEAGWKAPWRDLSLYAAWKTEAEHDRTPEVMGLKGFRAAVAGFSDDPAEARGEALAVLELEEAALVPYFHRLLSTIAGWAGYARYLGWDKELDGESDGRLSQLLTVRLVWDAALLRALSEDPESAVPVQDAWKAAKARLAAAEATDAPAAPLDPIAHILHAAYEEAWRRRLIARFAAPAEKPAVRKQVQAAFCIDVRSEVFRRALETIDPEAETIGFAGFYGAAIEYVPLGHEHGGAQCPVLLKPAFTVRQGCGHAHPGEEAALAQKKTLAKRATGAWASFKKAAVSSFGFVETAGLGYAVKLATDTLGLTRPAAHPLKDGLDEKTLERLKPSLTPSEIAGRAAGLTAEQRLALAAGALGAMSLTENFARLVVLTGHGSTSVNNPHATGLDCGACGGFTGEANARVVAKVLNDPEVRKGLVEKGIEIPADTHFLAALHDTTVDRVALFDLDEAPESHKPDLKRLAQKLDSAGRLARAERAALLSPGGEPDGALIDAMIEARSRDWSQVRPEWGLAGCAAFIAAPRANTAGLDLGGRSFLHSYDWTADKEFGVLELIMTAPMVVASWISLQYFGSSVDNKRFGSGEKVLHNVIGGSIGVLEGNAGDLRTGLPLQSVHDGEQLVHEPVRLAVVIAAPTEAMDAIIQKHQGVRDLLDNGWLALYQLDETTGRVQRYQGVGVWAAAEAAPAAKVAAAA